MIFLLMMKAVFAGSFDPPTFGHLSIIDRARKIFTEVHVVIAINNNKKSLFKGDERKTMLEDMLSEWNNVTVTTWSSLIVDYAEKINASVLLRGVRNVSDFSYEFDLALMNKTLDKKIETMFLVSDPKYFVLRSSSIKELATFGGDLSSMVPKNVEEALKEKFKHK